MVGGGGEGRQGLRQHDVVSQLEEWGRAGAMGEGGSSSTEDELATERQEMTRDCQGKK